MREFGVEAGRGSGGGVQEPCAGLESRGGLFGAVLENISVWVVARGASWQVVMPGPCNRA